jgi:hypothetical protein
VLGKENLETLECGHCLGASLLGQGKVKEGKLVLSEVYQERKELLGEEHPDTSETFALLNPSKEKKYNS